MYKTYAYINLLEITEMQSTRFGTILILKLCCFLLLLWLLLLELRLSYVSYVMYVFFI